MFSIVLEILKDQSVINGRPSTIASNGRVALINPIDDALQAHPFCLRNGY